MSDFNVDAFLEGLEQDKASSRGSSDRINKILMNVKDNQGTIIFVPFTNKKNNNFYMKVADVKEWKGHTTKLDSGEAWYKILPEEYYGDLSPENRELLAEVNGLYDTISEYEVHEFDTLRRRNYSLFYGVLTSHVGVDNNELGDNIDKPCLFIFPSLSPINAMSTAISAKVQALKGRKEWITGVLSPNNTGREGVMSITFKKATGPGYETTIGFEFNTQYDTVIDPKLVFDEEITKFFNDPLRDLLGWQGDGESGYFNVDIIKELRDDLKLELKRLVAEDSGSPSDSDKTYENKNGQQDKVKNAPETTEAKSNAASGTGKLPF